ncbi:MAG: hypothetical protein IKO42_03580 [Opitutales bacterium]|nr:hypothetical protein [Opitutales bacterium]
MKKLISTISIALLFALFGCNTATTETSYQLAQQKQYVQTCKFDAQKDALEKAALQALAERGWKLESKSPIVASLNANNYEAKIKISASDNSVSFDTTGSKFKGKEIVPLRLIDYLKKSMNQSLNAARYK